MDHTDVFGRSRKITKRELRRVKEQDREMSVSESRHEDVRESSRSSSSSGEVSNDSEEETIGPDIGLAFLEQKNQWETQEGLNKERSSLHYQDILFDGKIISRFRCQNYNSKLLQRLASMVLDFMSSRLITTSEKSSKKL